MGTSIKINVILVMFGAVYITGTTIDEFVSIENEQDLNQAESERTFFPDLLKTISEDLQSEENKDVSGIQEFGAKETRWKRFQQFLSYPQTPVMDMMKQTMAINYFPDKKDLFACLRDTYPLPKGLYKPLDEYDYVIIGAGSAGSVLASRLSEDHGGATVLLIEAGKPENVLGDIPMFVPLLQRSEYSWPYSTERQPGICLGSEDQRCYWSRGKAVGGSSATNYMLYFRCRPQDWDRIAADGNYGWSYKEVLPYFIKTQKSEVKKYKYAPYSGRDGELMVSNNPFRTGLIEAFLEAGRIYGNPTLDYNAPDGFGFGYIQTTIGHGHRWSAAKAFLHPHKRRHNLHILPETRATKIIIDPRTKRAYAVEYMRNNVKYTVRSRREIILSAGPIASPQLLMLSGVGPKQHLQQMGIPVIADLPVGRTLYDHPTFPGVIFKLNTTNASLFLSKIVTPQNFIKWIQFGEGFLTSPGTIEGAGYIKTKVSDDPELVPDIELLSLPTSINVDNGVILRRSWKLTDELYNVAFSSLEGIDTWSALPILLHPKSRGFIELRDTNPFSHPKIYTNYFKEPKDVATMIAGIRYLIKLGESKAFEKYGAELHRAVYPGCEDHAFGTYSYWECALRTAVITIYHPIATCRMGPPTDPEAVVDPELRVYGVKDLRVVDSSVIPRTVSGHTNAPTIVIGDKAADLIKETWDHNMYEYDDYHRRQDYSYFKGKYYREN